jgi:hypothetical protein
VRLFFQMNNNNVDGLQSQGGGDVNDDDDKEGFIPKPYRQRSLHWSNTYRKLIPYEQARRAVLKLGFISKKDWDKSVADGTTGVNPDVPNHPDEMYADKWVSWDEFLGLGLGLSRSYKETKNDIDDDEEEEDFIPKPYRQRSLHWSNTYRELNPYEQARQVVLRMGFISKEDWDESVADGTTGVNPDVPNHPDEMYADEWVSWDEFLGMRRSYEETKSMIQNVLHFVTMEEYTQFVRDDFKRAVGLRIPFKPDIFYRDCGWTNAYDFFGTLE